MSLYSRSRRIRWTNWFRLLWVIALIICLYTLPEKPIKPNDFQNWIIVLLLKIAILLALFVRIFLKKD